MPLSPENPTTIRDSPFGEIMRMGHPDPLVSEVIRSISARARSRRLISALLESADADQTSDHIGTIFKVLLKDRFALTARAAKSENAAPIRNHIRGPIGRNFAIVRSLGKALVVLSAIGIRSLGKALVVLSGVVFFRLRRRGGLGKLRLQLGNQLHELRIIHARDIGEFLSQLLGELGSSLSELGVGHRG